MVDDREDQTSESIEEKSTILGDDDKLWIKLKINPSDDDEHEVEDFVKEDQKLQPQSNNLPRICHVCGKGFRSGKALGGHMRIHFQTNKNFIFSGQSPSIIKSKKWKRELVEKKKDPINYKSSNDDTAPTCSICGKNFPSMKSLFGHMRCHPEREWRGIQPPAPSSAAAVVKASPLSSVSDAEPPQPQRGHDDDDDLDQMDSAVVADGVETVDLTKCLGGWSVTAKRGRKAMGDNSEEDEGMFDAVFQLLSLAKGDSCEADNKVDEFEATNSMPLPQRVPGSKKGRKKELLAGYIKDHPVKELRSIEEKKIDGFQMKDNAKTAQDTDFFAGKIECQYGTENNSPKEYYGDEDCSDDEESEDSEKTRDDQLLMNDKNFENTNNGNVVMTVNNKKKKKMRKRILKIRDLESVHDHHASSSDHKVNLTMIKSPAHQKYRCNICGKCFSTHQALGGHMSSHNKFRVAIQNSIDESAAYEDENLDQFSPTLVEENNEGEASSHQIEICNMNFSTGQMQGPSSQLNSAGEVSHTGRGIIGIDLNELPQMEEDADHAAAYGYASSSFNSVEYWFL
ncbi:hypothetical protein ACH5RR_027704 [Cinchona calisaya]|uniref:C2H2-type domain-containing protein n=1 Tax=Cinchona calisaya TaxID=153742 RepID=A0ABD2YLP8_9GENT